jgi:hypothetical protein
MQHSVGGRGLADSRPGNLGPSASPGKELHCRATCRRVNRTRSPGERVIGIRVIDSPCPRWHTGARHLRFRFEQFQWLAAPFWIAPRCPRGNGDGRTMGPFPFGSTRVQNSERRNERFACPAARYWKRYRLRSGHFAESCVFSSNRLFDSRFFTCRSGVVHEKCEEASQLSEKQ